MSNITITYKDLYTNEISIVNFNVNNELDFDNLQLAIKQIETIHNFLNVELLISNCKKNNEDILIALARINVIGYEQNEYDLHYKVNN